MMSALVSTYPPPVMSLKAGFLDLLVVKIHIFRLKVDFIGIDALLSLFPYENED